MESIFDLKEQAITETPLILFDCTMADGRVERWSTHAVEAGGAGYRARVLRHNLFEIQTASDQGVDGIPKISLLLANADSYFSELECSTGWKGARVVARLVFADLKNGTAASDTAVLFQGIANAPEEITESTFRLSALNRLSMQRALLPEVRLQRRCPWEFPAARGQREEALSGGSEGRYSRFYRCGYSADIQGGTGTLNGEAPYTSCGYTRADCQARGMFARFGGLEFVPPSITVRSYGERGTHISAVSANEARYNDFVPLVYGTAWYTPPVVFARNDGNLTHMEVLLGLGPMSGVLKVLVNDVEIPAGRSGANMTGTGWYNSPTLGSRDGTCNTEFVDSSGRPAGDPYGSMAYLAVVVPNRINSGASLPQAKVLAQGLRLPVFNADGTFAEDTFTNNPAWIAMDILRRSGWALEDLDVSSFAAAAAYCAETIEAQDVYGNPVAIPRFECNTVIQKRRSAGDTLRGIRNAARLYLTYGAGGQLRLAVEGTLAAQQPSKAAGSNSTAMLNGGWPAYEFGDGTMGSGGILRRQSGAPAIRLWCRSTADTPNRMVVEFQDSLNEFQQDSFSLVDAGDVTRAGQDVTATVAALGIGNYHQAARVLKFFLDKTIRGNMYVEFETSVKAFGLRPGDLIALTYLKEGLERQPFRILKIAPATNYRSAVLTAQIHRDEWYTDDIAGAGSGGARGEAAAGLPKPLLGTTVDDDGDVQFGIEQVQTGAESVTLAVRFLVPPGASPTALSAPLVSLAASVGTGGGTLDGGRDLYYAFSGVDAGGNEGPVSFTVRAALPDTDQNSVTITGLSFPSGTATFNVYRGDNPAQMLRIASDCAIAGQFTDTGLLPQLTAARDVNFDHANFYWRMEMQPEVNATLHSATTAGNASLHMQPNVFRGMVVRITRGKGAGQERVIAANTADTVTIAPAWNVVPDATSWFTIAETGWHFGAMAKSSPVEFAVPNRGGMAAQICGRAANANDMECPLELSTVTRWVINGTGGTDADVPPQPSFALAPQAGSGGVEVSGIGFESLANTQTVSAAILTVRYWDELNGPAPVTLASDISSDGDWLTFNADTRAQPGAYMQIEEEIVRVEETASGNTRLRLTRAVSGSHAAAHATGASAYELTSKAVIIPFVKGFFGSPASTAWGYPVALACARVVSAELALSNTAGVGPAGAVCVTGSADYGIRTLAGGQYSLQVSGYLSVDSAAAPTIVVETAHVVRDVFAVLGTPADAPVQVRIVQDGVPYCDLTIPAGGTLSPAVNGSGLPRLRTGAELGLSVLAIGSTVPGADLTVVIRL